MGAETTLVSPVHTSHGIDTLTCLDIHVDIYINNTLGYIVVICHCLYLHM